MALFIVPVPIGHAQDFTLRGLETLRSADTIILEEFKESTQWLRAHGISGKPLEQLNEHSKEEDFQRLTALCRDKNVALITDSGTPGFCDPGPELVRRCRANGITVEALPGPSSLMTLLSLSGKPIRQFHFRGFIPAENTERERAWGEIRRTPGQVPVVLMDTPYRLNKMCEELVRHFPEAEMLIGINLSQPDQLVLEGSVKKVVARIPKLKAEFILLLWP